MKISTVNRELQVLRRMFGLAVEWGKVERVPPRVRMIPGEAHRGVGVGAAAVAMDVEGVGDGAVGGGGDDRVADALAVEEDAAAHGGADGGSGLRGSAGAGEESEDEGGSHGRSIRRAGSQTQRSNPCAAAA